MRTYYAHLLFAYTLKGEKVSKGQVIGISGSGGTGPHLHFAVTVNGVFINPVKYLKGR